MKIDIILQTLVTALAVFKASSSADGENPPHERDSCTSVRCPTRSLGQKPSDGRRNLQSFTNREFASKGFSRRLKRSSTKAVDEEAEESDPQPSSKKKSKKSLPVKESAEDETEEDGANTENEEEDAGHDKKVKSSKKKHSLKKSAADDAGDSEEQTEQAGEEEEDETGDKRRPINATKEKQPPKNAHVEEEAENYTEEVSADEDDNKDKKKSKKKTSAATDSEAEMSEVDNPSLKESKQPPKTEVDNDAEAEVVEDEPESISSKPSHTSNAHREKPVDTLSDAEAYEEEAAYKGRPPLNTMSENPPRRARPRKRRDEEDESSYAAYFRRMDDDFYSQNARERNFADDRRYGRRPPYNGQDFYEYDYEELNERRYIRGPPRYTDYDDDDGYMDSLYDAPPRRFARRNPRYLRIQDHDYYYEDGYDSPFIGRHTYARPPRSYYAMDRPRYPPTPRTRVPDYAYYNDHGRQPETPTYSYPRDIGASEFNGSLPKGQNEEFRPSPTESAMKAPVYFGGEPASSYGAETAQPRPFEVGAQNNSPIANASEPAKSTDGYVSAKMRSSEDQKATKEAVENIQVDENGIELPILESGKRQAFESTVSGAISDSTNESQQNLGIKTEKTASNPSTDVPIKEKSEKSKVPVENTSSVVSNPKSPEASAKLADVRQ